MNYSTLTIKFQKGRKGTFIGKIQEVPEIIVRGLNLVEVRHKIIEAISHHQKLSLHQKEAIADKQV